MTPKSILYIAAGQALIATLGSLYVSLFLGWEPCPLCWYQRIFMYPLVIIIGVGIWRKIKDIDYAALPLAIIGWGIAAYHNLLQYSPVKEAADVCSLTAPCVISRQALPLGFVSLPLLSLIAFSLIIVCLVVYRQMRKESLPT